MNAVYLTEFAAFKQLQKIVDRKNSEILQVLWSLWDKAKEAQREKLPSFARLLSQITPDPFSWDRKIHQFKSAFLNDYYSDKADDLYRQQLYKNGRTDVCDFLEREAWQSTVDLLFRRAEKDSKRSLSKH